ncbi:DUF6261 family protein [Hoylesella enoeca]|uniref:DUF6261 family protein n=1 Tax=Hoylesella enoeca TaxID=76123 RepID=UPI00288A7804|nr:DUF6261 family protein [Hoylesella enoeca]
MKTKMKALQLPKILRIEGSNCSNYANSHHLQFQFNVYELVKAVDKQKLHLTDELLKIWADCLELETELNKQATATVQTEQMKALDKQRDDLLTNLFGVVRAQLKSPVQAVRDAAKALDKALGVYTGIQFKAVDAETAEVRGLLKDLERFGSEVTALGLAPVTTQLKSVNDEFQQTYATRQEKAVERKLPALTEVRPQTDAVFAAVCRYIEASYLFATTDEDRTMIERLVDRMNQESEHFKTTHKQSVAQKKKGDGEKKPSTNKKTVEKLLPAFEEENGFAPGTLSLTGKTAKAEDGTKLYELVSLSGESIWVKVEDGKLVKVEKAS